MRRDGRFSMPVVHIEQVPDEVAGQAELRRLSAAIASGRWTPPNIVVAGRRVTELPTWAYGPSTFALVLVVTLGTGGGVVVSGIGALLLAVFVGVVWLAAIAEAALRRTCSRSHRRIA